MLAREIIAVALLALAAGCNSSPTGEKVEEGNPVGLFGTTSGSSTLRATLDFSQQEDRRIIGGTVKRARSVDANLHFWHPDSASSVSAGQVTINGNIIPRIQTANGTVYLGSSLRATLPITFDGSYQVFNVAGDAGYPGFIDSVRSPNGATSISSPTPTDTVSKSAGFTITWNADPTLDGVVISIHDTCKSTGCNGFSKVIEGDPGSLTISPSDLVTTYPGPIIITVARGNYKFGEVGPGGPGKKYQLTVYSLQNVHTVLRP